MENLFLNAKPVWFENLEKELNIRGVFKTTLTPNPNKKYTVKIATSGIYNLSVNGSFVSYGPARAGKNHFRMDEYDVTSYLTSEENEISIDVCNYYANSYYLQMQPAFLQAELCEDGNPIAATGENGFEGKIHPNYIRKTQRYSFQRPTVEAYDFTKENRIKTPNIVLTDTKNIIERITRYPDFEHTKAKLSHAGRAKLQLSESYKYDRSWVNIGETIQGFNLGELESFSGKECQDAVYLITDDTPSSLIKHSRFNIYELPYNATGVISLTVNCHDDTTLYVMFDEILINNDVDFLRMDCSNAIKYVLPKGQHKIRTFEVYTMKYLKILSKGADCEVSDLEVIEYKHPKIEHKIPNLNDNLTKIYKAALETFRQNSVDLFTDCPSRERAGWLCDSFFSARVEYLLTGESRVEKAFLENFLHEETYDGIPDGVFPMCYPADHVDHNFIPNWAMWLVIQLGEYKQRTNDMEFIARYKNKVYKFLKYLKGFENNDGLLEKLNGWVFVEWSMANHLVQDVNYPSNMLYSLMLRKAAELYGDKELFEKSEKIKAKILEQSFNGEFFTDNAEYENGVLKNTGKITEVCQYYAFFCGIATPETHPKLFNTLINDFGPERKVNNKYPEVYFANAFIGNYLRLEVMMREGYKKEVFDNIEGYFLYMADKTGTLWEHDNTRASCNHGFASHVICWLEQ